LKLHIAVETDWCSHFLLFLCGLSAANCPQNDFLCNTEKLLQFFWPMSKAWKAVRAKKFAVGGSLVLKAGIEK
jgi:hypothetical protein